MDPNPVNDADDWEDAMDEDAFQSIGPPEL